MSVAIKTSKAGIISTLIHPSGHPSTYATLPTPSGTPFHAVPKDFDGPHSGCAVHFIRPGPNKVKGVGVCFVGVRHGGSEIDLSVTGEAGWLMEQRTEEELLAAFEISLPHVPCAWLQQMAQFIHQRRMGNDLRIR